MSEAFTRPANITCRYCGQRHAPRYMCDPVEALVSAMTDAAEARDLKVTDLLTQPAPPGLAGMLGGATVLCRQIVIAAGIVPYEADGKPIATYPALTFTGEDADGGKLPLWVFSGSPHELRQVRDTCDRMTEMAIRRAAQ